MAAGRTLLFEPVPTTRLLALAAMQSVLSGERHQAVAFRLFR